MLHLFLQYQGSRYETDYQILLKSSPINVTSWFRPCCESDKLHSLCSSRNCKNSVWGITYTDCKGDQSGRLLTISPG